ncbi:helix-turn-helix domain-containing protein [Alistipes putredinis]|uniref:helix-turn-helix domain-containing protein n=1 Tax=Alistipes putredinis TaxID=28117 RepID=UPI003A909868
MRNNIVQGSDSSEAEVFDLIKRIEKGLEKFGTNHRLILGGESYLTDKEISERLKVHRRTLQEYRNSGKLPYYMICGKVLYRESEIEKLLRDSYNGTDDKALL